jgi:hypothetical protein
MRLLLLNKAALAVTCSLLLLLHQSVSVDASHDSFIKNKEQCLSDLENDPYAIDMNDVPLFGEASVIINDRPVWTTLLMSFYSVALSTITSGEEESAFSGMPYGLCIPDDFGLMRCNAALVPYFLDLIPMDNFTMPAFVRYFAELPFSCMEQGGTLVHTSFSTDCLPVEDVADEVEFFGIPQCVPESCNLRRANRYWKERIETDLEELKSGIEGFPGGDKCKVRFRMETRVKKSKKGKSAKKKAKKKQKKSVRGL